MMQSGNRNEDHPPLQTARDWLDYLKGCPPNTGWLAAHERELFQLVSRSLNAPHQFHDAVELLLKVFSFFGLVRSRVSDWLPLLWRALVEAQTLRDREMQLHLLAHIGEGNVATGKRAAAETAFNLALGHAQERRITEMILSIHIGLIKTEATQINGRLNYQIIGEALALAREVDDLRLKASLYQTLAIVYAYRKESLLALAYGQTAYACWLRLKNPLELARTAIALSQAYRSALQLEQAARFMDIAQEHFLQTEAARQEAHSAYEKGSLHLHRGQYVQAQQWLQIALDEFLQFGTQQQQAGAMHALALALIEVGEVNAARLKLDAALETWRKLDYRHEQANALYALGYLAFKLTDWQTAHQHWQQAAGLCDGLPSGELRAGLEQKIWKALAELDDLRPDDR